MTMDLHPIFPVPALVALGLALIGLLVWGTFHLKERRVPFFWWITLGILRAGIIVVFLFCLLRPVLSWTRTTQEKPGVWVLLDASRSMATPDAANGKTRGQAAAEWLEQSGLADELSRGGPVQWFRFDRQAFVVPRGELAAGPAAESGSHYADALLSAWEQSLAAAPDQPRPARILLIGDGNDRGERDPIEVAQQMGVVIDTLAPPTAEDAIGSGNGSAHLVAVQGSRRILQGSESRFQVTVRQQGLANQPLTLKLKLGDETLATRSLTFAPDEPEQSVDLVFRAAKPGVHEYQIALEGAAHGKLERKITVEVTGKRHDVLFLSDDWRWDFKFLRRVLEDDPSFTFTGFLSRGSSTYVQFADAERGTDLRSFPQTRAEISGFDTIILGGVNPATWPPGLAAAIHAWVVQDGKSLIVLAGPKIAAVAADPELGPLLPVELSRESSVPLAGPISVQVNPAAKNLPFFFSEKAKTWSDLPPFDPLYPPLRKRPAATILLEATKAGNDYGKLIAAAEHRVGRGRVLYLGTDTFWKWQMTGAELSPGVTRYGVFWQQTLRALASSRMGGMEKVTLQPEKTHYEPGEKMVLRATLPPGSGGTLRGTVRLPDGREVPLGFAADSQNESSFVADFDAAQEGSYLFIAETLKDNLPTGSGQTLIDVGEGLAIGPPPVNASQLARLATGTGGRLVDPNDRSTWTSVAASERIPVFRPATASLWDNFSLLLLLMVLLGVDWAIRLRQGFV